MEQLHAEAEAFPKPYRGEKIEPEEQKGDGADVISIHRRAEEMAGVGRKYEEYMASRGILNQEQYLDVLNLAAHGGDVSSESLSPGHAKFMAENAGISLSPEAVSIYQILRDKKPDSANQNFSGLSDQELLAEALHIVGDTDSRNAFEKKYPHIFDSRK